MGNIFFCQCCGKSRLGVPHWLQSPGKAPALPRDARAHPSPARPDTGAGFAFPSPLPLSGEAEEQERSPAPRYFTYTFNKRNKISETQGENL